MLRSIQKPSFKAGGKFRSLREDLDQDLPHIQHVAYNLGAFYHKVLLNI